MAPRSYLLLLPVLALFAIWACDNDSSNDITDPGGGSEKSCLGCHSDEDALKEIIGTDKVVVAIGNKDDG